MARPTRPENVRQPRDREFWVVRIDGRPEEPAQVYLKMLSTEEMRVYTCGNEDPWVFPRDKVEIVFVRPIRVRRER